MITRPPRSAFQSIKGIGNLSKREFINVDTSKNSMFPRRRDLSDNDNVAFCQIVQGWITKAITFIKKFRP